MFRLYSTIKKDLLILFRDRVGVTFIFIMPVVLVLIITSVQNSAFDIVNKNKVSVLIHNEDKGDIGATLIESLDKIGMFDLKLVPDFKEGSLLASTMSEHDALLAIKIPAGFSQRMNERAKSTAQLTFNVLEISVDTGKQEMIPDTLQIFYNPVLRENYRMNIQNGLRSALQLVESKETLKMIRNSLSEDIVSDPINEDLFKSGMHLSEVPVAHDGGLTIPNATQHNIPAWTIFAMFFIVISLGSSIVKEKLSGSFMRLRTLPTNYLLALLGRLIVYTGVCLAQVVLIFSIGVWLFPHIGLPPLNLPSDLFGLLLVSVITALCAVSFAICVGIFARTQEQANGFGAVSIVILAALGGILVPAFAMPESFHFFLAISPLHWSLEAYYGLFLEGGKLSDVWRNLVPLLAITIVLQILAYLGLKKNNLV
ncbi:MAG: ABC transporter permease [Bacteroidia bacterium]|nr:ABC transporter permease [Bacteroidia bacterium]